MSTHKTRLAALAETLHLSRTPSPWTIAERLGAAYDLHPGDILAEAERIRTEAGPHATPEQMTAMMAKDIGISVDELRTRADALLEGIAE